VDNVILVIERGSRVSIFGGCVEGNVEIL